MNNPVQMFVDALNAKLMPKFGYVWRNNRWEWPNIFTGNWEYRKKWGEPLIETGEKIEGG